MSSVLTLMLATVAPFVPRIVTGGSPRGRLPPSLVDMTQMSGNHSSGLPQMPAVPPPLPEEWLRTFAEPPTPAVSPRQSSPPATMSAIDAVGVYVNSIFHDEDLTGVPFSRFQPLSILIEDYAAFRKTCDGLPELSPKKLSQTLQKLGCIHHQRDGRKKGGDNRRISVIELRRSKRVTQ